MRLLTVIYQPDTFPPPTQQISKTTTEGTTSGGSAVSSVVNEYNLQGRMAAVTTTAGGVVTETEYEYSDAGLRVQQTVTIDSGTPVVTEYIFDPSGGHTGYAQVVEEYIDDVLAKVYALGQDVIGEHHTAAAPGGAQTLLHLHDGHGSTRMLLNDLVELVQRYGYDAYGNHLSGTGLTGAASALTSLLYSGEFFDKSINQQYLRARWYDATTGRFNRLDPFAGNLHDPQSLHKYAYVHGDPVNAWDPSGKSLLSVLAGIGIRVGLYALVAIGVHTAVGSTAFVINTVRGASNSASGLGGLDVSSKFHGIALAYRTAWLAKTPAQQKAIMDYTDISFTTINWIRAWDIVEFGPNQKSKFASNNATGFIPDTLTIGGMGYPLAVYPVEEVNYFLWGLMYRVAFDSGMTEYSEGAAISTVLLYRTLLYPHTNGTGGSWGRVAWVRAGWIAGGGTMFYPLPIEWSYPKGVPNTTAYTGTLRVIVGDPTSVVNSVDTTVF